MAAVLHRALRRRGAGRQGERHRHGLLHRHPLRHAHARLLLHTHLQLEDDQGMTGPYLCDVCKPPYATLLRPSLGASLSQCGCHISMPPPTSGHGVLHVHLLLPLRRRIPRFRVRRLRLSTLEMATGPVYVSRIFLDKI